MYPDLIIKMPLTNYYHMTISKPRQYIISGKTLLLSTKTMVAVLCYECNQPVHARDLNIHIMENCHPKYIL